jgi:hypothetical protein
MCAAACVSLSATAMLLLLLLLLLLLQTTFVLAGRPAVCWGLVLLCWEAGL